MCFPKGVTIRELSFLLDEVAICGQTESCLCRLLLQSLVKRSGVAKLGNMPSCKMKHFLREMEKKESLTAC